MTVCHNDIQLQGIKDDKARITISSTSVSKVSSYKYLGVIIQNNLRSNKHVTAQVRKTNQQVYCVWCLKKLNIDTNILSLFYNSVASSVLVYAFSCWYNSCDMEQKREVCKFDRRMEKLIGRRNRVENPRVISSQKCMCVLKNSHRCLPPFLMIHNPSTTWRTKCATMQNRMLSEIISSICH